MSTLEIVLTAVTSVLGAGNLYQFANWWSMKRKASAEADQAQLSTLRTIIDTYDQQFATLQKRYDNLQEKYDNLLEKYDKVQTQYIELRDLIGKGK